MIYLKNFELLDDYGEKKLTEYERRRIYTNYYPLGIFPLKNLKNINFSDITIFYGNNGSGKSTLLNIIAEKLDAIRKNKIDKGTYFSLYVDHCNYEYGRERPEDIKIVTSDDVFDYLLDVRAINGNVNRLKDQLANEYLSLKFSDDNSNFETLEEVKKMADSKRRTMSQFIRGHLGNNNIQEMSNGESALLFWEREIKENGIYILDEPENSLSAENQLKLKQFIEDSVRFYHCQFIISTHSPFLLNLMDALIYDLDDSPVKIKKWTELSTVKIYHDFFKEREEDFE